jgi:hypothetical protein
MKAVEKKQKKRLSNRNIVRLKILTALWAFFAYCLFFFENKNYFIDDFKSLRILFPLIFITGIIFIIWYISNLVNRLESNTLWRADRLYLLYQFVWVVMLVGIICRSFFANLAVGKFTVIVLILVGIVTLCTPPIRDNNNDEF